MVELQPAHYTQGACHTAQGDRQVLSSLVCVAGVQDVSGGGLEVTKGGSPLQVNAAGGSAFVDGTNIDDQGLYHVFNDGTVSLSIAAGDPTDSRLDAVIARVYDAQYAGTQDEWSVEVAQGTPSPAPALPTLPDNSLLLATVEVAPGATNNNDLTITDERVPYQLCQQNSPDQGLVQIETYSANSSFTKADFPNLRLVKVRCIGGGGAGGGSGSTSADQFSGGSGGGSGGYTEVVVRAADLPSSVPVTVGDGGAGVLGGAGGAGTESSFGTFATAGGGFGGFAQAASTASFLTVGGPGGGGSVGPNTQGGFNSRGMVGGPGINVAPNGMSGVGGSGPYGGGGKGMRLVGSPGGDAGDDANGWGGGGGGAASRDGEGGHTGGAGFGGVVIVEIYL